MDEFIDKISKKFFKLDKKLDDLSDKLKEVTGIDLNFKAIILGIMIFIFVAFFVKIILGAVFDFLYNGEY